MRQKFQIRNITKLPRPLHGPDTRTVIQKKGHYVSYRNAQDKVIMLRPDEVKIINEPNDDIITLVSQGYLSLQPLKDITDALQSHSSPGRKRQAKSSVDSEIAVATAQGQRAREARASLMGEAQNETGVTELESQAKKMPTKPELEGAVNPDGTPNFTVTATKNSIPPRQRRQR